jgi:hypothetical protein
MIINAEICLLDDLTAGRLSAVVSRERFDTGPAAFPPIARVNPTSHRAIAARRATPAGCALFPP